MSSSSSSSYLTSFNRLGYDANAYRENLNQSVKSADYVLQTPWDVCVPCLSRDAGQLGRGVVQCTSPCMVDIDSELQGITRRASKFSGDSYTPDKGVAYCKATSGPINMCPERYVSEDTRLNNPPCTLRSTGWNRWEWLCRNPQDQVEIPFDMHINSQLVARDNHRPILPSPLDPKGALPPNANAPPHILPSTCAPDVTTNLPMVSWRDCDTIANY